MRVSIIITAYNRPDMLNWTILSSLRQVHRDTELVVVDGGSTDINAAHFAQLYAGTKYTRRSDGSFEIAKGGNLGRTNVVSVRTENEGISKAKNTGAALATGEALIFLDDDNWIEPTFIEKTLPHLDSDVGIVSTDMHVFSEIKDSIVLANTPSVSDLTKGNSIPATSLINKRAFVEAGGFKENVYEDWELWINILKRRWRMNIVHEPLFHYRSREGSLISQFTKRHDEFMSNMRRIHPDVF